MPELIDKQASMRAICDGCFKSRAVDLELRCHGTCNVIDILQQQPTIEAEPVRHGQWMKIEPTINLQSRWKCSRSKCGGIVHAITDYFPYCGAKMD